MAWSGGTFSRVHDWTTDAGSAINIEASRMDAEDDNFATGINNCLTKDGQNAATADLPMGGNNHTNVGNATARNEYASAADVQDQDLVYAVDTGSADAYAVTCSPAFTALEEGMRVVFRASATNTGASTIAVNGLTATAIQTPDGNALTAGMIVTGGYYEVTYDANGSRFVMTSPHSFQPVVTAGSGLTGGGTLPASVTLNVGAGTGISVAADSISTDDGAIVHDSLSGFVANEHIDHSGVSITAGNGLTGGGTITQTRDIAVGAGTGITVAADSISTNDGQIVHDNLSGFVAAEHVNHASVSITAGTGLSGGGTIDGNVSLAVDFGEFSIGGTLLGTDYLLAENGGVENRQLISSIPLSIFNNNSGWTSNTGTVTSVSGGNGLTGSVTTSGSLAVGAGTGISVAADSVAVSAALQDLHNVGIVDAADHFLVSSAAGTWTYEDASQVKTTLGLGTGDSPQFTALNVGHASDTTVTRAAAGKLNVEGKAVLQHDGSYTSGDVTFGTGAATGGASGDIHFQYTA